MLRAGVNVGIGTDSLASNPSLSVLDELRFLRQAHPDVLPDTLLAMGTLYGARALGLDRQCGSLTTGKRADLVVIPLPGPSSPWYGILDSDHAPMTVYLGGFRAAADV
jgi:cytosine/adenosine deaminase-related metal-dependent hydrolase